ncbi:MAG: RNA-protein complex protein Nop10 [archaeon]
MIIRRCGSCQAYTLRAACPKCGAPASSPHPAKFSPEDTYGKYRRMMKAEAKASAEAKVKI